MVDGRLNRGDGFSRAVGAQEQHGQLVLSHRERGIEGRRGAQPRHGSVQIRRIGEQLRIALAEDLPGRVIPGQPFPNREVFDVVAIGDLECVRESLRHLVDERQKVGPLVDRFADLRAALCVADYPRLSVQSEREAISVLNAFGRAADDEGGVEFRRDLALEGKGYVSQGGETEFRQPLHEHGKEKRLKEVVRGQVEFEHQRRHVCEPGLLLAQARSRVEREESRPLAELRLRHHAFDGLAVLRLDGHRRGRRPQILAAEEEKQDRRREREIRGDPDLLGQRYLVAALSAVEPREHGHARQEEQDRRQDDSRPMRGEEEFVD